MRSKNSKALALAAFTLLFSGTMKAQDSLRLDLQEVIKIALCDNPSIIVADQEIELKKYGKKETISGLFPDISASGSFQDALKQQKMKLSFSPEPVTMGQQYTINGTFNLSLPLVAPQLWKTIQLNEKDVQLSLETARSSKIDMVSQVKQAYYSLLLARDAFSALQASFNTAELNAKNIQTKFEMGKVSEYDRLVADVQYRNIRPQLVSSENAVKLATMQIKVLMGVDVDEPLIFTGSLSDYEEEMFKDLMQLQSDTSLDDNSSLKQLDIQAEQIKITEKINKMGYVPTLAMGLSYGWQSMHQNFKLKEYDWYAGSTLSLSLSIPIFDGGKKYFKTKQNKISYSNLMLVKDNTIRQLELSIANSLNNITTSVEEVSSNKESVLQAEKAYSISQIRYDIGSGTLLEMNSSETALTQARLQYSQSIYDYLSARATLEATLGKPISDECRK